MLQSVSLILLCRSSRWETSNETTAVKIIEFSVPVWFTLLEPHEVTTERQLNAAHRTCAVFHAVQVDVFDLLTIVRLVAQDVSSVSVELDLARLFEARQTQALGIVSTVFAVAARRCR
jgi:hypothetical protein